VTPRELTKEVGFSLAVGQKKSFDYCPFCEGGANKDKGTFSVTRDSVNLLLYNCKRNKCRASGRILAAGGGYSAAAAPSSTAFKPFPYTKPVEEIAIEDAVWISEKWHLELEDIYNSGWVIASEEKGFMPIVMPVLSPRGMCRGHVLRIQNQDDSKTVRTFKTQEGPWISWYRNGNADIVVVEDSISALACAAEGLTGVSLCGTEMSPDKFEEIVSNCPSNGKIWIALDRDAVSTGFEYLKRYRLYFPNINLLMLRKDIKNMTIRERLELGPFSVRQNDVHS
jgi:hypothetical protein